jgi:anthranilate/para-aminobenzoate synthase component II
MKYLKKFETFKFLEESFEDNFPDKISIYTSGGAYTLIKSDFTREVDIIRCSYWHNTAADGNVSRDGEPDLLMFDIHFMNTENGLKTHIDISYGDKMVSEFSIEKPNKIRIHLYNGFNSKFDHDSQFGFQNKSILDLVKLFNKFDHDYELEKEDLSFIDKYPDSYKEPQRAVSDSDRKYFKEETPFEFPISSQRGNEYSLSQGRKVLVINNSTPPENRYLANILRYLQVRGINHVVASTPQELKEILKTNKISSVISTGSEKRVSDDMTNKMNWIVLKKLKCPFLGICFGFQSLCRLYGSEIESGTFTHDYVKLHGLKSNLIFKNVDLESNQFSVSFNDFPKNCPKNFNVICKIKGKIAGVANEFEKKYGLLFHPEDVEQTWKILDNFIDLSDTESVEQDALKKGNFNSFKLGE